MSALSTAFTFVVDMALGAWLGAMAFFSFVAAPRTFAVLDRDDAGRVVNDVFPRYYLIGVALGALALAGSLGLIGVGDAGVATAVLVGAVGVAVALAGYARWVLVPKMDTAGDDAFDRYHRESVVLNGVTMLAVAVGLLASHL